MPAEIAASAAAAQSILRNPDQFQWYVIPLFAIVSYIYASEMEKRNWKVVFAGLAFWAMDWVNEIWNSLVFHFTGFAPVWGAPAQTAYLVLMGLNIEIIFMFAISGVAFAKMLPKDPAVKVLGLPNRWFYAVTMSVFCVFVEILLNLAGALTWEYPWWSAKFPLLIVLFGYMPFFVVAFWVHDMTCVKRQAKTVGALAAVVGAALVGFGSLDWI
jgi:hypothetical protein